MMLFTSVRCGVTKAGDISGTPAAKRPWRGPTIAEIARESGVGSATVDRVVNGRDNVRGATAARVLAAIARLREPEGSADRPAPRRIAFICDCGVSFSQTLESAVQEFVKDDAGVTCEFASVPTWKFDAVKMANAIERAAGEADALVLVAREDLTVNRAVRAVVARNVPVICLTTDLPTIGRHAFVGSDPTSAGTTAAFLLGQVIGEREGKVLLVYSAPYRVQEERELGFRRVLRAEFPGLAVDERVNSNDDSEFVYRNVLRYVEEHGPPAGIYNIAAGNIGVGKALTELGLVGTTVFIGHELNPNSRHLLETGVMTFAIGHDVELEVETAIGHCLALLGTPTQPPPPLTRVRVYTKYNCT